MANTPSVTSTTFARIAVTLGFLVAFAGCSEVKGPTKTTQKGQPTENAYPDWQAEQVLTYMQNAYANAESYSDNAVLYLLYRMQGRPIDEPQPWAFRCNRAKNQLAAQLFDTKITFDGRDLGCRVYDIESENLDNQFLLLSSVTKPITRLFADKIGRHFAGGYSDLPLRSDPTSLVKYAAPPTIQLMTGEASFPWLAQPEMGIRLDDELIEGIVCFHIQTKIGEEVCDFWIEQKTGLLHQMLLPNSLLEAKVTHSSQIEDLKFVARFHNCEFNSQLDPRTFAVNPPADASLVKEFVKLPEAFPSELIGRIAPEFVLSKPTGAVVSRKTFEKKTTALLWIAGYAMEDGINKLDAIQKKLGDQVNFGVVYSDAEMRNPGGEGFEMTDELKSIIRNSRVSLPFYCDKQLNASSTLRIKAIPSVLVFDKNSKMQFARPLSDSSWDDDLTLALNRIENGDDLAEEMIAEYGKFYSQYRTKLLSLRADRPDGVAARNASTFLTDKNRAKTVWTANSTLRPSNMARIGDTSPNVAVLDGYQTLVVFDELGREAQRKELQLPEGQGVTRLRTTQKNGKPVYAAFTKMGEQVHWFDETLNRLGSWPLSSATEKITDCRFYDSNDGNKKLLVAVRGKGIVSLDIGTGKAAEVTDKDASEIVVSKTAYVGLTGTETRNDQAILFKSDLPDFDSRSLDAWNFTRILLGAADDHEPATNDSVRYCATGLSVDGQMQAIGLNEKFGIQWKVDAGLQNFRDDVEPIVYDHDHNCWIVADSEYGLQVVSNAGEVLFSMRIDGELQGIASASTKDRMRFVYAVERTIKCIEVDLKQ